MADSACVYFNAAKDKDATAYDTLLELSENIEKVMGNGKFVYTLSDEESKININSASEDVLSRLTGISPALASKISSCPLKPFCAKEELMYVEGFSEEAYLACKDLVSVHSNGKVNVNTAPVEVLKAVGIPDSLAARIERFRMGSDGEAATDDDGVFHDLNELSTFTILSAQEQQSLVELAPELSTDSENFCLHIDTFFLEKKALKYDIIIGKGKIKSWKES